MVDFIMHGARVRSLDGNSEWEVYPTRTAPPYRVTMMFDAVGGYYCSLSEAIQAVIEEHGGVEVEQPERDIQGQLTMV